MGPPPHPRGPRSPLGPLLVCSGVAVAVCVAVLAWRLAAAAAALVSWHALGGVTALALGAELVRRRAAPVGTYGRVGAVCARRAGGRTAARAAAAAALSARRPAAPAPRRGAVRAARRPPRVPLPLSPLVPPEPRAPALPVPPQAFYALFWRPRRAAWNEQPCAPHAPVRLDAMDLFRRFVSAASDASQLETYLKIWFQGMAWDQIRRGNMEELMAYGMRWEGAAGCTGRRAHGEERGDARQGWGSGAKPGEAGRGVQGKARELPPRQVEGRRSRRLAPAPAAPLTPPFRPHLCPPSLPPGFWYRTPAEMESAGLGHIPKQMVDELERVWRHTFPPGYTQVRPPPPPGPRGRGRSELLEAAGPPKAAPRRFKAPAHTTAHATAPSPTPQGAKFMAHLWEDLRAQYRPLALYLVLEAGAALSWAAMLAMGFTRHTMG
jgi:hypothetical protein